MKLPGETEVYPKSAPFEAFLATAIHDIWRVQNHPRVYVDMIRRFVRTFIPSIFAKNIKFDLENEIKETEQEILAIEKRIENADPFDQDDARKYDELSAEVDLAERMFKATLDALFEQRLLIPIRKVETRKMGT